jgi:hypothetical protein
LIAEEEEEEEVGMRYIPNQGITQLFNNKIKRKKKRKEKKERIVRVVNVVLLSL